MAQYNDNLQALQGKLMRIRNRLTADMATDLLNDAIRTVQDRRQLWSGLLGRGILQVPSPYTTGTIAIASGSSVVTGTSTSWPVSDLVNTTMGSTGVSQPEERLIVPGSMANINVDTLLFVDDGASSEVVAVRSVSGNSFRAVFLNAHSPGTPLKCSSLTGRQLDLGDTNPIFTVRAVKSATEIEMDMPWGGDAYSGSYKIAKYYYTVANDLKHVLLMFDTRAGNKIKCHVSQQEVYTIDGQRSSIGDPVKLVDFGPSEAGNMLYELYPHPSSARQIPFLYYRQWPPLKAKYDVPPPGINPSIFVYGALAQAFSFKIDENDTSMNAITAATYEKRFENGVVDAIYADNAKIQHAVTWELQQFGPGLGANFWQNHDPDVFFGGV